MGVAASVKEPKGTNVEKFLGGEEPGGSTSSTDELVDPDEEEMQRRGTTTIVNLYARCEKLCEHRRAHHLSSMIVLYAKRGAAKTWKKLGESEVVRGSSWPNYRECFGVPFRVEQVLLLRLEVYRVRDELDIDDLRSQAFVGCAEFTMVDTIKARMKAGPVIPGSEGITDGWFYQSLQSHRPESQGQVALWAEEDIGAKSFVSFEVSCSELRQTDFWKRKPDPYLVYYRTTLQKQRPKSQFDDKRAPTLSTVGATSEEDTWVDTADVTRLEVMRSEIVRKTKAPRWRRSHIAVQKLCNGQSFQQIAIEVYDWYKMREPRLIGSCYTTFDDLSRCNRRRETLPLTLFTTLKRKKAQPLGGHRNSKLRRSSTFWDVQEGTSRSTIYNGRITLRGSQERQRTLNLSVKATAGHLLLDKIHVERKYSFLDFLRGGMTLRSIIAVDLTRSNASINDPHSLHYMSGDGINAYATTIKAMGDVLSSYTAGDEDGFLMYGFGAKIPPTHTICSHCFSLTGNFLMPAVPDVKSLVEAYQNSLKVVTLHGPTRLTKVLDTAFIWARPHAEATTEGSNGIDMKYHVLLLITQGGVEDDEEIVAQISEAAAIPLSIVIVGVGEGDLTFLRDLNAEVKAHQRHKMVVPCGNGHICQQVTQSALNKKYIKCTACRRELAELRTRWHCGECAHAGVNLCQDCAVSWAQQEADVPIHRDIVNFVHFDEYRGRPEALAGAALSRISQDVCEYYEHCGVKPRGLEKFEDVAGNPMQRTHVDAPSGPKKSIFISPKAKRDRMITKESNASSARFSSIGVGETPAPKEDALTEVQKQKIALEKHLAKLPPELRARRNEILQMLARAGYEPGAIDRTMREGVPEDSVESFVENLVHCSHGAGGKTYQDCLKEHVVEEKDDTDYSALLKERRLKEKEKKQAAAQNDRRLSLISMESLASRRSLDSQDLRNLAGSKDLPVAPETGDKPLAVLLGSSTGMSKPPDVNEMTLLPGSVQGEHHDVQPQRANLLGNCTICLERPIDVQLAPCGHAVACEQCVAKLASPICPFCRALVHERRRL